MYKTTKTTKKVLIRLLIVLFLLVLIKFIYDEHSYIIFMFQYLFMGRPWAAIPLPKNIQNIVKKIMKDDIPDSKKYTFIDFGCADGNVIDLIYKTTNKAVCIELEKTWTDMAEKRFKGINNIQVLNMDMNNYKYENNPTILFMYEPLWSMKKEDALPIYQSILGKINEYKDIHPFYIIYVSGVNPHLDEAFFNQLGFHMKQYYKLSRFLGFKKNNVYLFERQ